MGTKIAMLSGVSIIALGVVGASASGLPTGGKFSDGKGSIATSGASMTVKQSSTNGVIDWKTFSVGVRNSVAFDNGSGATLNKVTGKNLSTIAGSMTATGSLYLMNSLGVIVSGTGKIVTGGTFIASSGSITTDPSYSAIRDIAKAKKKVSNAGSITASGGSVFLIGNTATNTGTLTAKKGDAVLAAASKMSLILQPQGIDQQIEMAAGTGNAVNNGTITGAAAEVAAYGGEAQANASKKGGTITALGAKKYGATLWLISTDGKTSISGHLKTAAGGAIETAGSSVAVTGSVSAGKGGRWDWTAQSITVGSKAGALIDKALAADTNVSLNTLNYDLNVRGQNITIDAPSSWSTKAAFSITSNNNIAFDKSINVTGAGTMAFVSYANGGYGEWDFANSASLNFGTENKGATLQIDFSTYKLIYNVAQLQNINKNLGGSYALAQSIDAGGASSWIPIGTDGNGNVISTPDSNGSQYGFFGFFDGLGHTIDNLSIHLPDVNDVGLFGYTTISVVRDVAMVGGTIVGGGNVGALSVVTDGYWDTQTTGQSTSAGGLGLTTKQLEHALPAGFSSSVWGLVKDKSMPYLLWEAPGTGTRPKSAAVAAPDSDALLTDEMKRWRS